MNKLLCNHEVSYIKKKGKQDGAEKGVLSKSVITGDELTYAANGKESSFVICPPDSVVASNILPGIDFYHWNLKTM